MQPLFVSLRSGFFIDALCEDESNCHDCIVTRGTASGRKCCIQDGTESYQGNQIGRSVLSSSGIGRIVSFYDHGDFLCSHEWHTIQRVSVIVLLAICPQTTPTDEARHPHCEFRGHLENIASKAFTCLLDPSPFASGLQTAGAPIANGESPGTSSCLNVPLSIGQSLDDKDSRRLALGRIGTQSNVEMVENKGSEVSR